MTATTAAAPKAKMPRSVPFIIGNEAAERFSFYGMRAILPTFLVAAFYNPTHDPGMQVVAEAKSNEMVHYFVFLAYFMPLLGGILSDWFFGKYRVILWVSIIYTLGHVILSFSTSNLQMFQLGVVVIAVCAGCVKSCVSANVGDQFGKDNQHLMTKLYSWFYFSINAGSFFSTLLIPVIYDKYGADIAFGVPGILMGLAALIFWLGRKKYVRIPAAGIKKENFLFITLSYFAAFLSRKNGKTSWEIVAGKYSVEAIDGVRAVYRVLAVFAFIPIFWAMWDQNLSEWVLQATKMDLTMFGYTLLPEQVQTVNPMFLLTLIPVFAYFVYPFFEKLGIKTSPLRRIGMGLFFTGLSFVVIALIQQNIDAGGKPSVWWQVLAYFILSAAEVLVSVTGLEYAYTQSPKSMKSTMTALWLLTTALGNLFTALINGNIASGGYFAKFTGASYYWLYIGIIAIFLVVFMFISKRLPEKSYLNDDADIKAELA